MEALRGCKAGHQEHHHTVLHHQAKHTQDSQSWSDQPVSALKYTMVRLVIRNGQTLKIQPLFFFFLS